ncbi:MAG: DEAD/DEAH box helicase [Gammaproteobacteria bacterium]|nr:DEAD/DEAH box helicase [Gammaproteobacteria bacterium]MCW8971886.1 DEAD/DEAH box helicase [Gammaproteobacteria bacterium]MCW8994016.1 DEAD/DEAH box helicase [Gammaproteobacteria bacterium]
MSFTDLNLDEQLLRAIQACGFTSPSDIQKQAIPVALEGHDLMASAQTGTGKTAAFVLPALQRLLNNEPAPGHGPRVLILTPTRELATQVTDAIRDLGKFSRLRSTTVVGGMPYPPQIKMLRQPLDLLVATPGRLIDHFESGRLDFGRLEMLVLDEADRMLDMGFVDDVERIAAALPEQRQTLLFSATLEGEVRNVARRLLKEPQRIQIAGVKTNHDSIDQHIHQADDFRHKQALLAHHLGQEAVSQAIVFTATKRGADDLAKQLREQGHRSAALHGDMSQGARRRTVEQMRRGQCRVLVATDVAARGIDIKGLSHVFNFDLPMAAEDYIHRIGRTGRGGASGTALSLVGPQEWDKVARIEKLTGCKLNRLVLDGLEPRQPEPKPFAQRGKGGRPGGYGQKRRFGGNNKPGGGNGRKPTIHHKRPAVGGRPRSAGNGQG